MSQGLRFASAAEYPLDLLAELFTRGFENYIVPVANVDRVTLARHVRKESIDLAASRVVSRDDSPTSPIALALIALRGNRSRLATMGIIKESRGMGVGSAVVGQLLADARTRGDARMTLEVIESNAAAVALYTHAGFEPMRQLVGWTGKDLGPGDDGIERCPPDTLGRIAGRSELQDLPWQLEPATLMQTTAPTQCFHLEERAFVLVGGASETTVNVAALLTIPEHRRRGYARRLLAAVAARFEGRSLSIPQVWPEDVGAEAMRRMGFVKAELTQREMSLHF